jgi:ubiquinone/menaquinone biosynthesis C-methylase UbiE
MTSRNNLAGLLTVLITTVVLQGLLLAAGQQEPTNDYRHGGRSEHSFADAERYAAIFDSPQRARWQKPDELVAALEISPGSTVADVGAGTGYFAARFSRAVGPAGTVLAADIEPGMVAYLRRRAEREGHANLIPILASADNPRLPDRAVDLVFFCNTWHHIGDRVAYARRLRDDLARGGRVVVVDFLPGDLPVGPPPTEKLGEREVVAEFEKAGFQRVHSLDFLPYQYVLVFQASPGS